MAEQQFRARVRYVIGPDGSPLTIADLPPTDTKRWVIRRKAEVVAAVRGGLLSIEEACERYRLTVDEFLSWQRSIDRHGLPGLRATRIHVMAGNAEGAEAEATFRANLVWAASFGHPLTVEPLNRFDMPGYFLNDYDQAARILDDLAQPDVGVQFDLWHAARIHGDAAAVWARHAARSSHVQIAGFPNRHEPGGGGFDLASFAGGLPAQGYAGWIAAEYRPARSTLSGLGWLAALRSRNTLIGD